MFFLEEKEEERVRGKRLPSSMLEYTESKYTGNFKNFCCSICAHQFYPPREFFDYENIMDAQAPSFLETNENMKDKQQNNGAQAPSFLETMYDMKDKLQNDGMGCCVACRKDMYGGVADSAWERNFAASSNKKGGGAKESSAKKGGEPTNRLATFMSDMAPRNPDNMRDYKSGKHGGPIDPSVNQNSALVLGTPRSPSTAGT